MELEIQANSPLDSYLRDGYVVIEQCLDRDLVEDLAGEVERIHRDFFVLKSSCTSLIKLGEWCIKNPHVASDKIRNYFFSDYCMNVCRSILGPDVDFYWATTGHKPPQKGRAFPWHQDSGYGKGPLDYVTFWTALDDVDEENGCLWAIPGSHKQGIFEHEFRKSKDGDYGGVFLKDQPLRVSEAIPLRLQAGQIVCLNSKVIHETRLNQSQRLRRSLISAYACPDAFAGHELGPDEIPESFLRKGNRI